MPLRDHFRPPLDDFMSWSSFHALWPGMIVVALNRRLPATYIAHPRVHTDVAFEIDVGTSEQVGVTAGRVPEAGEVAGGGTATAVWAPPRPTLDVTTDPPDDAEYEVLIYDVSRRRRLVAAVEIVSPANKNRPVSRQAFVAKCAALLREGVSVSMIDLVTTRQANLYVELLDHIGQLDAAPGLGRQSLYAAACRWRPDGPPPRDGSEAPWRLQAWAHAQELGRPLPTLPLWLSEDLAVPLELEPTYEETCRALRLA